jgi:hypothetical protein
MKHKIARETVNEEPNHHRVKNDERPKQHEMTLLVLAVQGKN